MNYRLFFIELCFLAYRTVFLAYCLFVRLSSVYLFFLLFLFFSPLCMNPTCHHKRTYHHSQQDSCGNSPISCPWKTKQRNSLIFNRNENNLIIRRKRCQRHFFRLEVPAESLWAAAELTVFCPCGFCLRLGDSNSLDCLGWLGSPGCWVRLARLVSRLRACGCW